MLNKILKKSEGEELKMPHFNSSAPLLQDGVHAREMSGPDFHGTDTETYGTVRGRASYLAGKTSPMSAHETYFLAIPYYKQPMECKEVCILRLTKQLLSKATRSWRCYGVRDKQILFAPRHERPSNRLYVAMEKESPLFGLYPRKASDTGQGVIPSNKSEMRVTT
ncbi:hypothetical protein RRG08_024264 [Elysia crispata]|uniref:Uncharacterized protein n=1 Tax=Elysia crispata TaxID=231223 RepID=A0AAE0Z3X7_9GAST|nr:hypothetical protein RRG08_024264 [Elysia crispata]